MAEEQEQLLTLLEADPDLQLLEQYIKEFNILEALGVVRQELRHSDFLAFLLDPAGKHGMGDHFLKHFLQRAVLSSESANAGGSGANGEMTFESDPTGRATERTPVSSMELGVWRLGNAQVYRELYNIDVLVIDEANHFVVIIENKIDTTEHSDQLARYLDTVRSHFPQCNRILGIYLTPDGSEPSLPQDYRAVSYRLLHDAIEELISNGAPTLGPSLLTLLRHYTAALRRHIVSDSTIDQLCRRIYARHKAALDLIYEHRLDRVATMADALKDLVAKSGQLILDKCDKTYIRFYPKAWDLPVLRVAQGWTSSNMLLQFHLVNEADRVRLVLFLGPTTDPIRERLFDLAQRTRPPFQPPSNKLGKWPILWEETIVQPSLYEEGMEEEMLKMLNSKWSNFINIPTNPSGLTAFTDVVLHELAKTSV